MPFVARASASSDRDGPHGLLTLDPITVGASTLDDVPRMYGSAELSRVGGGDEADPAICYAFHSADGVTVVVFETGVMGSYEDVTGFRLSAEPVDGHCTSTTLGTKRLRTENGVHLGQSREQFLDAVPIHFAHRGSELLYESVTRRAATPAELKRLRVAWPNEKQGYYDVTTTVRATFKANRLVDLYVRRIESY